MSVCGWYVAAEIPRCVYGCMSEGVYNCVVGSSNKIQGMSMCSQPASKPCPGSLRLALWLCVGGYLSLSRCFRVAPGVVYCWQQSIA